MNLTERDKEIIKDCIDRGVPLPTKYRLMLFEDTKEVELLWQGKSSEVTSVILPFQSIEQIDEPRGETGMDVAGLFAADLRGRQSRGWTNKLIWGDNKLVLSSLKNGPIRREIEDAGGLKLIYIDPPFSAGIDYTINVDIGDEKEQVEKTPSVLEELAYRNTWGQGGNSFLSMLHERVPLMRDLLADDGCFMLRIDHHWGHYVKVMLDEIFNKNLFQNEIVVNRIKKNVTNKGRRTIPNAVDSLFIYFKTDNSTFKNILKKLESTRQGYWHNMESAGIPGPRQIIIEGKTYFPSTGAHLKFTQKQADEMLNVGRIRVNPKNNKPEYWVEPKDFDALDSNWTDIPGYSFSTNYPTENSEVLLERVLEVSTNPDDLVADFFCGSGTTLAVAEKLGRKWVGCDIGRFSIHTTRKRLIGVQRQLKKENKSYRSFEILNLGKYERQYFVGIDPNLPEEQRKIQTIQREEHYLTLILSAYKAERAFQTPPFHGKKGSTAVFVGPIDAPVTSIQVNEIVAECRRKKISKVDILGFEFEMSLTPMMQDEAKQYGVSLSLKYIPKDVFDKRAVEKGQVVFYNVAYVEVLPKVKGMAASVTLKDFGVFYRQDDLDTLGEKLKAGGSKVTVENGQVVKVTKDKHGKINREILTKKWTDWIDYWAVYFDYENRKEIIRVVENGKEREIWTGNYIFENEWQSYRTRKDRTLELTSILHEYEKKGKYKIAVKVIDIFGNDTTKVVEVKI